MFKIKKPWILVMSLPFMLLSFNSFAQKGPHTGHHVTQGQDMQNTDRAVSGKGHRAKRKKAEKAHHKKEKKKLAEKVKDCQGDQECIQNAKKEHREHQISHHQEKLDEQKINKMEDLETWKSKKVEECQGSETCIQEAEKIYNKRKEQIEKQHSKREGALDKQAEKLKTQEQNSAPASVTQPQAPTPTEKTPAESSGVEHN